MVRCAIVGGSGYTGVELIRIIHLHPEAEVVAVTSRTHAGEPVDALFPSLAGACDLRFREPAPQELASMADVVFTAVPHQAAMAIIPDLLRAGCKVVDLSADFRLSRVEVYQEWYGPHSAPELLNEAVYGLPELYRNEIASARLVANPGCYPTSSIIPLAPLLRNGTISPDSIIIDSKSGTSGAGRTASLAVSFCEVNEAFKAYKVGEHRHTPEIEQELSLAAGRDLVINFQPHLVPMSRGILSTIYCTAAQGVTTEAVLEQLSSFYAEAPFVRIRPQGEFPNCSHVKGSNFCDIGAKVDRRTGRLILVSAIDNLVKGAAGQAVQNMNIMFGLEETAGLGSLPLYP